MLLSSSVVENDYSEWSAATNYSAGSRVIKAATHRIYESLIADNAGNDPAGAGASSWIDIAPTNRWAIDRRSVVWDKSVSGRGDLGGRRSLKKNTQVSKKKDH